MLDFTKYKSAEPTRYPNRYLIPINNFGYNDVDIEEFNEIYQYCLTEIQTEFVETNSGGISVKIENWRGVRWLHKQTKTINEIILKNFDGRLYRFIVGYQKDKHESLSGRQAFNIYTQELKKDGVDIKSLYIENGEEVKKTIPSPKIDLVVAPDRTYYNAHHLDLNSAFNAGMIEAFPVLETSVRRMYNNRRLNVEFKNVLNMTQGAMQSQLCQYKLSHVSKAGYTYTNRRLDELTVALKNAGCRILAYNTDGIWYQSDNPYHDEGEGTDIGQWKNDHVNCKIRFKSKGCYEFVENGKYTPVVRGESTYERIKPRTDWEWGDIYKGTLVQFMFIEGIGLVKENCEYEISE